MCEELENVLESKATGKMPTLQRANEQGDFDSSSFCFQLSHVEF